jgi:hypothetical protein
MWHWRTHRRPQVGGPSPAGAAIPTALRSEARCASTHQPTLPHALRHAHPCVVPTTSDASLEDLESLRASSASFAAALAEAEAIGSRVAAAAAAIAAAAASSAPGGDAGAVADAAAAAAAVAAAYDPMELTRGRTRHLWLGNLNTRLPRSALRQVRTGEAGGGRGVGMCHASQLAALARRADAQRAGQGTRRRASANS